MNEVSFAKLESRRETQLLHDWVYDALCEAILSGEFVPGVSVTLRGIAERLGVSPMPVREAIRRLVAEGALEVLRNRRVSVVRLTATRIRELHYARLQLEPELASLAFEQINKKQIKALIQLDRQLNQSLLSGDVDTYIRCNRGFHFGIYESAQSTVLFSLVRSLWLQFAPLSRIVYGRVGTDFLQKDFHADAIAALQRGDQPSFRQAIKADIKEGMDLLSEQFASQSASPSSDVG